MEGVGPAFHHPIHSLIPSASQHTPTPTHPQFLLAHEGPLCGVLALASVMAVVLSCFLLYHLQLALRNVTTNETFKWQVARARVQRDREKALRAREISGACTCVWICVCTD